MHKPRLVSAAAAVLVLSAGGLLATPALTLAAPVAMASSAPAIALPAFKDFASLNNHGTFSSGDLQLPLQGLEFASSEPELSPMLAPMLALYGQLLTLEGGGSGGIALQRLQARLSADVAEKTGLLDINEVLAADFDAVEVVAISAEQLRSLGIQAGDIDNLPLLATLTDQVKAAMMELPQGLSSIDGPVALAIWGQNGLASLVIRAN
ncbi:hypothetical protein [Litorivivens sp.]|uniref:hypothetical protein n=1 Tax=Litorivivens sp. TaxID=2020868 RepID=UPI003568609A